MSRCIHGVPSPTKRCRNCAAVTEPAGRPPTLAMSAIRLFSELVVGRRERHPPGPLALGLRGGEEGVGQRVVVGEDPGHLVAERDDDRAGQRREVDDRRAA